MRNSYLALTIIALILDATSSTYTMDGEDDAQQQAAASSPPASALAMDNGVDGVPIPAGTRHRSDDAQQQAAASSPTADALASLFELVDPTADESKRTVVGQCVRFLGKRTQIGAGYIVGLGTGGSAETEHTRTRSIYEQIEAGKLDEKVTRQFLERQWLATQIAFTLIQDLNSIPEKPESDQLPRIVQCIQDAQKLQEFNIHVLSQSALLLLINAIQRVQENIEETYKQVLIRRSTSPGALGDSGT